MKVVILAGGRGTHICEESHLKPKPMITIGNQPILWHIMKYDSSYGFNDFVICYGYKSHCLKEYFADDYLYHSDATLDFFNHNSMTVHNNVAEPWKVKLVDVGSNAQTGCCIKRVQGCVGDKPFMPTSGGGVNDVSLSTLLAEHKKLRTIVTLTTIQPGGRFGVLGIGEYRNIVTSFWEKGKEDSGWTNGGFIVVQLEIFHYLYDDEEWIFECTPVGQLSQEGNLDLYKHNGFWNCVDTQGDCSILKKLWGEHEAPWKVWAA